MLKIEDLKEVSRSIVAKLFRCTPTNINRLVERGMPQLKNGRYDLFEVVGWRLDEIALMGGKAESKESQKWLIRWRRSKALRDEFAHKREAGEYIGKSEAIAQRTKLINYTVGVLENLPARLSGQLVGKNDRTEIANIIDLEVAAMRHVLADGLPYSDQTAEAVINRMGGLSPRQALVEKVRAQAGMPVFMDYDPRRKVFVDQRDGTEVSAVDVESYIKKFPYKKKTENGKLS